MIIVKIYLERGVQMNKLHYSSLVMAHSHLIYSLSLYGQFIEQMSIQLWVAIP